MTLQSAHRISLFDQVTAQLREQITSGRWPVGTRIPTEPELVEQLGVARNTLREAVRALAHNGLLDIRQGSGTYVVATSELAGVMRRRFENIPQEHIKELRGTLETSAAALAAVRRTDEDLALLDEALHRRETAWSSGDLETFVHADATFHQTVVAAAHNPALTGLYADLSEVMVVHLREHFQDRDLTPDHYLDHARLVTAIRNGDPLAATRESAAYFGPVDDR